MIAAAIGLGHADPGRGLAVFSAREVKGENHFVTAMFIDLCILAGTGGVNPGGDGSGNPWFYGFLFKAELHARRDGRKGVLVGNLLIHFRQPRLQTAGKIAGLVPFMGHFGDEIALIA